MIVTKCTPKGIEYSGTPELLEALPSGMIRKLEATFGKSYPHIYNIVSGLRYSDESLVLECAVKIVQLHERVKYEQQVEGILQAYATKKPVLK